MSTKNRKLKVSVGPSTRTLAHYNTNEDQSPMFVLSPHFEGHVVVRVKDFDGVVPGGCTPTPTSAYFGSRRRQFSIQCTGRFKEAFNCNDVVFGAVFDAKVSPPTGTWLALKFASMIDPALEMEVNGDSPYFLSPLVCAMNTMSTETATSATSDCSPVDSLISSTNSLSIVGEQAVFRKSPSSLPNWTFGGKEELKENSALLCPNNADFNPRDSSARRKYFQKLSNRLAVTFVPEMVYMFEIFAPFINMNTFDLSLGINVNVFKLLNNQPMRLVAKCRNSNKTFFCVEFRLVNPDGKEDSQSSIETCLGVSSREEGEDPDDFVDAQETTDG